ncbi:MAG: DEAD/DEAH box helicase [Pseudomonadota bacterium]
MTFKDLGLAPNILQAVEEAGYSEPTPIQSEAIPHIILGGDVTGVAQTGTGKTAAFVLPMIHRLSKGRARARMPRCLILAPTRELAAQVAENFEKYGKHLKLSMALLIGGVSFRDQDRLLMAGVDVLIATPGRMIDQFERGKLLLTGVETLIIDEADRMLDMGFIPDIEKICALLPPRRQTLLFSATFPKEIAKLAEKFQKLPKRVEVSKPAETASTITQYVLPLETNDAKARRHALRRIITDTEVQNGIVFCNRKREVDIVAKSLIKHGFDAAAIHGDLPQSYRTQTLERFRNGDLKLLIASDVAARGLDIPEVSHVFNFAPPPKDEDYVHRIGRTGRAGRTGESYTIVCPEDEKAWAGVLRMIGKDVNVVAPDGLAEELADLPPDTGGRGRRGGRGSRDDDRRGRRSERNSRGGRSERSSGADGDKGARDSEASKGARSERAEQKPRAERTERSDRGNRDETHPRRERSSRRREREPADTLPAAPDAKVGFGDDDDIPDFLKR